MNTNKKNKITAGKKIITGFMLPVILSLLVAPGAQATNFQCLNNSESVYNSCDTHGGYYDSTHNYFDDYPWCYCKGEGCTFGSTAKPWGFCGKNRVQATVSYKQWLKLNENACQCKQDGSARGYCGAHGGFGYRDSSYNSKKWCYVKDTTNCTAKNELAEWGVNWSFCHDSMTIDKVTNYRY